MTYTPSKVENGRVFLQYSNVAGDPLSASGIRDGELVIQAADGKLYFKSSSGDVENLAFEDAASDGNTYARKDGAWVDLASAAALQFRQGTDAERLAMDPVPASGEPIYTTDTNRFFIGDGTTTGGRGIVTDSDAYVICQPGDDLLAKYTAAKALTPGGNAKTSQNRAALLIYPGYYETDSGINIDTDYVDVIGLGSQKWSPSVFLSQGATFGGEDVRIVGLSGAQYCDPGGSKRFIVNCSNSGIGFCVLGNGLTDTQECSATFIGCAAIASSSGAAGALQATMLLSLNQSIPQVFSGLLVDCLFNGYICLYSVFQGRIVRGYSATQYTYVRGAMQGVFEHCSFPAMAESSAADPGDVDRSAPTAFGATCTISNASPAVVTSVAHGLLSGMRVKFTTTGALPTGLSTSTTYYVQKIDADTFNVATSVGGTPVDTSSAGSGTHTAINPTGKEGGWYSYCTFSDQDYSTT